MSEYDRAEYKRARADLLAGNPLCHWCKRKPATQADHLIEVDRGGSHTDGMVPSCGPCNARRGAQHLNRKRQHQQNVRNGTQPPQNTKNTKTFLDSTSQTTPTPFSNISANGHDSAANGLIEPLGVGVPSDLPRLSSAVGGYESFGGAIAQWSEAHLGRHLFPWQLFALEGAFQVDEANTFVHSTNLVSTGRQNGKTTMLSAIVGWCLIELPQIWGRPVRILSTAHELSLATEVFEELREVFELWEESGLAKVTWAYGRNKVVMADGSTYVVKAATGKKHGGTYDILIADELWAISEASYFGALKPSQIAVPSPLAFLTSTAGDESSKVFLRLREAALADIDKRKTGSTYMCEWSLPPGVDPLDQNYWGYANPSLGRTITVRGLQDAAEAPDRSSYLRAHCNQWVAAAGAWINPGVWAGAVTEPTNIEGGVLAVDNSIDEARYVAVRAVNDNGRIVCNVAFVAESSRSMWEQINAAMENDPKLKLAITPGLDLLTPERWAKRRSIWGYAELLKYTGLVRNMITEGILYHTGEQMLAEHVNRAVLVRANGSVVISSQRSPGPIELARCLVAAASMVARPGGGGRAAMGSSR
jgi:hypothetical protein